MSFFDSFTEDCLIKPTVTMFSLRANFRDDHRCNSRPVLQLAFTTTVHLLSHVEIKIILSALLDRSERLHAVLTLNNPPQYGTKAILFIRSINVFACIRYVYKCRYISLAIVRWAKISWEYTVQS